MRFRLRLAVLATLALCEALAAQSAPFSATKVGSIGCDGCGDARELAVVGDVVIADNGDVLLLDTAAPMVRLFSRDGRVLLSYGAKGAGPGEFEFPLRAVFSSDRSVRVVDMRLRRITHFAADGKVVASMPTGSFMAASAARRGAGELFLLTDDFRGTRTVERWSPGADKPVMVTKLANVRRTDGVITFPSMAVSPDGEVAVAPDIDDYRVLRFALNGDTGRVITRDVARVRRTPEEEEALRRRLAATRARVASELGRRAGGGGGAGGAGGGRAPAPAPVVGTNLNDLTLKPHFPIDALRYDDEGRLWILTSRGGEGETVFDVFGRDGSFMGSVNLRARANRFAVTREYLVTAGENDDGVPILEIWRFQRR